MRHAAIGIVILGVGLAGSSSAMAQQVGSVNVVAEIDWNKTINVVENVYVEKALFIKALGKLTTPGGGEAAALAGVGNKGSTYTNADHDDTGEPPGMWTYGGWVRAIATIDDGLNFNNGVMQFNQDVGVLSNQGNLLAVSDAATNTGMGDSQAEVEQYNVGNTLTRLNAEDNEPDGVIGHFTVSRKATLTNSVNANIGIINANQNAGELNNQTNANAVGVGVNGIAILGESALGQTTAKNQVYALHSESSSSITDSINGNIAQVSVNQASGGANNQSSTFNFSAILSFSNAAGGITAQKF